MTEYKGSMVFKGMYGLKSDEAIVSGASAYYFARTMQEWYHPLAAGTANVVATVASVGLGQKLTLLIQPDFPRNISVTCDTGAISNTVVIVGTNQWDAATTETLTLNGIATITGSVIFKTITSINQSAGGADGAFNLTVGLGSKLGTKRTLLNWPATGIIGSAAATPLYTADSVYDPTSHSNTAASGHLARDTTNSSLNFATALGPTKIYIAQYTTSDKR